MKRIAVISSSVRDGRLSHRVALFLARYLEDNHNAKADLIDLRAYDFPLFHERLFKMADPPAPLREFAGRISAADGVVVVSPVYNASYPAALKNVVDVLFAEWAQRPVLVVSVTDKSTPGIATVQKLQTLFLKMNARVAAPLYTVLQAGVDFSPEGIPRDEAQAAKYAAGPVAELMWMVSKNIE